MNRLNINNFKSLIDADIRLGKLTIFSGLNGSGKSSALQVLAMLKQSTGNIIPFDGYFKLKLRGPYVNLGKVADIYCEMASSDTIDISLSFNGNTYSLSSNINDKMSDYLLCQCNEQSYSGLSNIFSNFQFIQADRIVPGTQYEQASSDNRELHSLGVRGEYSVDYLSNNTQMKISSARSFPKNAIGVSDALFLQISPTDSLIDQVCGWMQHISPGVKVSAEEIVGTDSVKLKYKYTGESITSDGDERRPTHVGFGLTYSLPIILGALIARKNSFLLLENPEAHLHPQGQFAMGLLLAKCAEDGVNILVETHSDHVLNGIRVAVKNKIINDENVAIHYFSRDVNSGVTFIKSPNILPDGSMTNWPAGFFDQWTKSLDLLLG